MVLMLPLKISRKRSAKREVRVKIVLSQPKSLRLPCNTAQSSHLQLKMRRKNLSQWKTKKLSRLRLKILLSWCRSQPSQSKTRKTNRNKTKKRLSLMKLLSLQPQIWLPKMLKLIKRPQWLCPVWCLEWCPVWCLEWCLVWCLACPQEHPECLECRLLWAKNNLQAWRPNSKISTTNRSFWCNSKHSSSTTSRWCWWCNINNNRSTWSLNNNELVFLLRRLKSTE